MAKERGWWKITFNVEPDEDDLIQIGNLVKQGYTEGEIVQEDYSMPSDEERTTPVKTRVNRAWSVEAKNYLSPRQIRRNHGI